MKINKISFYSIIILLLFILVIPNTIYADDEDEAYENIIDTVYTNDSVESSSNKYEEPIINSKSAIIYNRNTNSVIWEKNMNEKRAMASTTKIMTAIIVLEKENQDDVITISKKAARTGGSRLKLNEGDKITINDLLYGLMLRSRK